MSAIFWILIIVVAAVVIALISIELFPPDPED